MAEKVTPTKAVPVTKFVIVHGDKGGVGKSFVAQAMIDYLLSSGEKVAVIDSDTRNADVSEMFERSCPTTRINARSEDGWMDIMDFVMKHAGQGYTVVMNTPGGLGEYMKSDMKAFADFLARQDTPVEMELWFVLNGQVHSMNLLNEAWTDYGAYCKRLRVVCNLHFANDEPIEKSLFTFWQSSVLRTKLEKAGAHTIYFPGLHIRVVTKLQGVDSKMPFSWALDKVLGESLALEPSLRYKLEVWRTEVGLLFASALSAA